MKSFGKKKNKGWITTTFDRTSSGSKHTKIHKASRQISILKLCTTNVYLTTATWDTMHRKRTCLYQTCPLSFAKTWVVSLIIVGYSRKEYLAIGKTAVIVSMKTNSFKSAWYQSNVDSHGILIAKTSTNMIISRTDSLKGNCKISSNCTQTSISQLLRKYLKVRTMKILFVKQKWCRISEALLL